MLDAIIVLNDTSNRLESYNISLVYLLLFTWSVKKMHDLVEKFSIKCDWNPPFATLLWINIITHNKNNNWWSMIMIINWCWITTAIHSYQFIDCYISINLTENEKENSNVVDLELQPFSLQYSVIMYQEH